MTDHSPSGDDAETATRTLHRLTSFTWAWYAPSIDEPDLVWSPPVDDRRVVRGFEPNDLDRFPWFYKRYEADLPRLPLPRDLPSTEPSAVTVLSGTADVSPADLDLPQLARLLHLSAGVVRTMERPYTTWLFRAAGSAGGRFPLELYVAVPEGRPVPAGVHWYDPEDHALVRIAPPPEGARAAVVVTGVPWRTGWRYRERGFRHIYWDAGTMLSQLLSGADAAGLRPHLHTRFPDERIGALVGSDGVHEWPVAVVALGDDGHGPEPTVAAATGRVDAAPVEFPLITAAQRAGDGATWGPAWDRGHPVEVPLIGQAPVESVILSRGSQRRMDPNRGLSLDVLRTSMQAAMRGIDLPHRVVVHDVADLATGVYRWPDLTAPARRGELRQELYLVALEQGLARDAAFVVIGAADLGALDDRAYRDAHLAAGLVEGRLHLLAYALGAGASGMTFIDGEIAGLLDEALDGILLTCVGVPGYRSATGGAPGAPTSVRKVTERV